MRETEQRRELMTSQNVRTENRREKQTKGKERTGRQYYNDVGR